MPEDKENDSTEPVSQDDFNEKEEIEKLQEKIKKMSDSDTNSDTFISNDIQMLEGDEDAPPYDDDLPVFNPAFTEDIDEDENHSPKKFIVTADVKNVDFFDKLSVEERSKLFNELLSHYIQNEDKINAKKKMKKLLIHLTVAAITLVFAVPAAFYVVNKAIHLTVMNYKGAQANFEKLYESRGVILEHQRRHGN